MLPVMAHLLGPVAFGIYAFAQPTVTFFVTLAESGIGLSLAREDESNTLIWSTAYWMLLISFSVMSLFVAGSGYFLAEISGHRELIGVMIILSFALPLMAISIAPDARIFRRGDLKFHSIADILSTLLSAITALFMAINGWGIWSLAGQYITVYLTRAIVLNIVAFERPSLQFKLSALIGHIDMSGALLARRSGELVAKSIENALYGRIFGAASLGSYTVAMQTARFGCDLFMNPPSGALYAYALINDKNSVQELHFKITYILSLILLPGVTLSAVIAPRLFSIALGNDWSLAASIFQPLALGYAVTSLSGLNDAVLMSNNQTWRATIPALSAAVGRIVAVLLGAWFSPIVIAWLAGIIFLAQALWLISGTPSGLTKGWYGVKYIYSRAVITALAVYCTSRAILTLGDEVHIIALSIVIGVLVWMNAIYLFLGKEIREYIFSLIKTKMKIR